MKNEIFETKKKINYILILKYILFLALFFVLWKAGIKNNIYPFAIGLFVALCWCNQNVFLTSAVFCLSGYLASFSLSNLFVCLCLSGVIILAFCLHRLIKKPIKIWLLAIYQVVGEGLIIYYNYSVKENLISAIISIIVSVIFMIACIKILKVLLVRGIGLKLTIDEIICLCFFLGAISLGLKDLVLLKMELGKIFTVFIILLSAYVYSGSYAVIIGLVLGIGQAFGNSSLLSMSAFALIALVAITFRTSHPYYSIISVILCDIVLGLYFNVYENYTVFSLLSTILGAGLFAIIKKDVITVVKILFGGEQQNQASRDIVNRSRNELCKKMYEISNIFFDMNKTFKSMVKGVLPASEAKQMLIQEVNSKVCADCPERYKCLKSLADETNQVFDNIITAGFERGKTTILDVPPFLSTRCSRINLILQSINQLIISYKQYSNMVVSMDTSRLLVADQLEGISKLLGVLATETQKTITFDTNKENQIIDELNYYNILTSEVVMYEKDTDNYNVSIVLKQTDKDSQDIIKVLSKVCKTKMILVSSTPSQLPNFYINCYRTAPKFDLIYGSSGCPKLQNKVSGDSYSFIRLTDDKVLLAICDGMGAGEKAKQTSDTAINLIENFYKAGFDNDIILNSVNKFLNLNSDENYSALDLCVVDLKTSSADFVKVGAPEGIIKHNVGSEVLQAGALPLGILDEMKPVIDKKFLCASDMIVMCSDGVIDAFGGIENLKNYIDSVDTINPQVLSDLVLKQVMNYSLDQPKDDCTIICARVFDRI